MGGNSKLVSAVNPRRYVDLDLTGGRDAAFAFAGSAGSGDHAANAMASRTGLLYPEESGAGLDPSHPLALNAGLRLRSGLSSAAAAFSAITPPRDLDLPLRAPENIVKSDLEIDPQVAAAAGPVTLTSSHSPEESLKKRTLEDVSKAGEDVVDVREAAAKALRRQTLVPMLVVELFFLLVAENLKGFRDLLEGSLRPGISRIFIRVVFERLLAVGLLDQEIFNLIDSVISSLVDQKFLSDEYYSDAKSKAFLRRGYSLNKIRYNLIKKGIDEKYIKASISKIKENESDPDFFSAIKICKRRRIGPSREESNRTLFYKKDISILARSGFSYEISKKVLEIPKEEFKKFCKMI